MPNDPRLYISTTGEPDDWQPAPYRDPESAALAAAEEFGMEEGDTIRVILATEDDANADEEAGVPLMVTARWRYAVTERVGDIYTICEVHHAD